MNEINTKGTFNKITSSAKKAYDKSHNFFNALNDINKVKTGSNGYERIQGIAGILKNLITGS